MSKQTFDPNNISGRTLAEIGRLVLTNKQVVETNEITQRAVGDYTDLGWLDMRVEEICKKGKL